MTPHDHHGHHHDHDHGGHEHSHTPAAEDLANAAGDDVTECLVMSGTPVIKPRAEAEGLYRDHDGQRYWFCCAACGPLFDADPERYVNAV